MFEDRRLTEKDISNLVGKRVDVIFSSNIPFPPSIKKTKEFLNHLYFGDLVVPGTILTKKSEDGIDYNFVYGNLGNPRYQDYPPQTQLTITEASIDEDSMWHLKKGLYLLDANFYSSFYFSSQNPHKDYPPTALALDLALRVK